MPSAFSQCLKSLSEAVALGDESPPNSSRKKRGGEKQDLKATPAKKLRESKADVAESAIKTDAPSSAVASEVPKAKSTRRKKSELDIEGDTPAPKSRGRKAKPEGPYTVFKEEGAIPEPSIARKELPAGTKSFKAVAWNLGGLRGFLKNRPDALAELARREQPDVLGLMEHKLQEAGPDTDAAMKALLDSLPDYESAALHCSTVKKGYSGTLILLRKDGPKPVSVEPIDLPSAKDEGRLIIVEFETFFLVLAYVPNSGDGLKRLDERIGQWDVQLREKLQELAAKKHTVLLGDLNVAHQDKDIWNVEAPHVPKSAGTTPEERESFSSLLDAGFVDGFAKMHPDALGAFTYWSIRAGNRPKNRGLRLDYAVTSSSLVPAADAGDTSSSGAPALADVFHLIEMSPGDHCPVGVLLSL